MQIIETNILGELRIYKEMHMKPNYSALQRKYGIERHTIKKYYVNNGIKYKERKAKVSKYGKYEKEILEIVKEPEIAIRSLYQYLVDKYGGVEFTYSGLKSYTLRKGIKRKGNSAEAPKRCFTFIIIIYIIKVVMVNAASKEYKTISLSKKLDSRGIIY